jgi:cytochrome P450
MMLAMKDKAGNPAYTVGEIVQSVLTLLGGGQDTTANLIGGITMMFTQNPDQQALLVSDFSLLPKAVAEGVRRKGPALGVVRRTTGAVTMHGVDIPAGAIVYLSIQGANMDPDMFDDPGRFDIRRPNADKHLGFGLGRHACVGQPLARLETEIAIEALYRRLPGLKIDMAQKRTFSPSFGAAILESLRAYW